MVLIKKAKPEKLMGNESADFPPSDVDECSSLEANRCHENAMCTNTEGSYVCRCKKGFEGNGFSCTRE